MSSTSDMAETLLRKLLRAAAELYPEDVPTGVGFDCIFVPLGPEELDYVSSLIQDDRSCCESRADKNDHEDDQTEMNLDEH